MKHFKMKFLPSLLLSSCYMVPVAADLRITQCNEQLTRMINSAIRDEIPNMISNTTARLTTFHQTYAHDVANPNVRVPSRMARQATIQKLFQAIIFPVPGKQASRRFREQSLLYIQRVINTLTALSQNIRALSGQTKNLQISCYPSWLQRGDGRGLYPDQYRDTRYANPSTLQLQGPPVTIPGGQETIQGFNSPGHDDMLVFNGLSQPYPSVILLNQHNEADWTPSLTDAKKIPYSVIAGWSHGQLMESFPLGTVKLDDMIPHHISSILLWALLQIRDMVDDPIRRTSALTDKTCGFGAQFDHPEFQRQVSHGWQCLRQLARSDPDRAVINPTAIQYLTTGLYFENVDWSLGVNRDLMYAGSKFQLGRLFTNDPWEYPNVPTNPSSSVQPPAGTAPQKQGFTGGAAGPSGAFQGGQDVGRVAPPLEEEDPDPAPPPSRRRPRPVPPTTAQSDPSDDEVIVPPPRRQRVGLTQHPSVSGILQGTTPSRILQGTTPSRDWDPPMPDIDVGQPRDRRRPLAPAPASNVLQGQQSQGGRVNPPPQTLTGALGNIQRPAPQVQGIAGTRTTSSGQGEAVRPAPSYDPELLASILAEPGTPSLRDILGRLHAPQPPHPSSGQGGAGHQAPPQPSATPNPGS